MIRLHHQMQLMTLWHYGWISHKPDILPLNTFKNMCGLQKKSLPTLGLNPK